ncbi:uncharacterized protein HGUI_01423 [Hanseniaspora guilliermondii]|uniref:AAA+ ATPase domain-containing protein n=1 Tax=Hanseniaspora guilliermondii TaxID=56406 RepID=A0A1L0CWL9_9ASCO|nr:uncharacterized protein HGUI_01423 [Hanseniaspora guilliermondii]
MSNKKTNSTGFLNKLFSKNKGQDDFHNDRNVNTQNKSQSLLLFDLLELYEIYSNNYSYFKSICLQQDGYNDTPIIHGVQGLKNLITELRFQLHQLNGKYPYLVVLKDPENIKNDEVKIFNSLYLIIKKSENVLEYIKEENMGSNPIFGDSSDKSLSEITNDKGSTLSRKKSSSNMLAQSNTSLQQNKMFKKRVMRTMRDHPHDHRSNSTLNVIDTNESKVPSFLEQKKRERLREEQKAKRLNVNTNKSYSNSSRGSNSSIKYKKKSVTSPTGNKAKNNESDLLIDLTDNTSKMDLVGSEQEGTNDPFDGFDSDYVQPKVTKPTKISTPPARKSFESKATNVSLQAATLAAVGNNQRQKQNTGTTSQQPVAKKPTKVTSSKKIPILENSGQMVNKNSASNTDVSKKSDKELLEDEILAQTPEVDYKVGKQIFQEILVARSNQRPLEWDDIIGLDNCKNQLKETIVFPFLRPDLFSGLREPINGLLLYGPPGTGKTMLAKCVAYQTESTFFNVSVSSITSKFLGESEKLVRSVFILASKLSPSIIFIDEIDSLLGSRGGGDDDGGDDGAAGESSRRFKNEFLTQWSNINYTMKEDGTYNRVLVLGCTNLPWVIDDAARRRFQKRIYCPLPNEADRIKLIEMLLSKNEIRKDEGNIKKNFTLEEMAELASLTEGFSNSDLLTLCKDASMEPIRELIRRGDNSILNVDKNNIRDITIDDFKRSLHDNKVKGSVNLETLRSYDKWTDQFGS